VWPPGGQAKAAMENLTYNTKKKGGRHKKLEDGSRKCKKCFERKHSKSQNEGMTKGGGRTGVPQSKISCSPEFSDQVRGGKNGEGCRNGEGPGGLVGPLFNQSDGHWGEGGGDSGKGRTAPIAHTGEKETGAGGEHGAAGKKKARDGRVGRRRKPRSLVQERLPRGGEGGVDKCPSKINLVSCSSILAQKKRARREWV